VTYNATVIQVRDEVIFVKDGFNEVRTLDPKKHPNLKEGDVVDLDVVESDPTAFGLNES
jgi:hypothetical protein